MEIDKEESKTKEAIEESAEVAGGICSAALSSICCWGPLLLALFGVGSGVLAPFTKYKWIFIILAAILLSRALYLAYKSQNKRNIIIIWGFIFLSLLFIIFPYIRFYLGI